MLSKVSLCLFSAVRVLYDVLSHFSLQIIISIDDKVHSCLETTVTQEKLVLAVVEQDLTMKQQTWMYDTLKCFLESVSSRNLKNP